MRPSVRACSHICAALLDKLVNAVVVFRQLQKRGMSRCQLLDKFATYACEDINELVQHSSDDESKYQPKDNAQIIAPRFSEIFKHFDEAIPLRSGQT